ncbi:MAG: amidase [Actinomycetia bacterium]|nr:amidase [Actinomycetes bacterium]
MSRGDLTFQPVHTLARLVAEGQVSAVELLDAHLERIEEIDDQINAVVTVDEDGARTTAEAADRATAAGESWGPLHGVPATIKDALAVAGLRCTGGAIELTDNTPTEDATVVSRVKGAGAVIMGKTNLPRWSSDAQASNEIFGTTNNPWDLTRGPGGSSGGAAAAVATGMAAFDLGTDIGGSVRLPAHFCGVWGHKPTFGIVPAFGYIDHPSAGLTEPDINVVGPIARTGEDLALLLDVIAGAAPDQTAGWRLELPPSPVEGLAGTRVGMWLDDPACPVGTEVAEVLGLLPGLLDGAGAIVDPDARPDVSFDTVAEIGRPLIAAATSPARSDEEFGQLVANEDAAVDQVRARWAGASTMRHRDWLLLTEERARVRKAWAVFFETVDVLLCPVAIVPAFPHVTGGNIYTRTLDVDGTTRAYADLISWTSFIGFAYLPSTVVPVGLSPSGLPVGVQVVAPHLADRTALRVAQSIGELTGGWQMPPGLVPSEADPR